MSDELVKFGKHKGERWTRVPVGYLRWLIDCGSQHASKAKEELDRRGTIIGPEFHISNHAIDRFYLRYRKSSLKRKDLKKMGGIYSALYKLALEALQEAKGEERANYKNPTFVFKYGELDIVLATVM